MAALDYQLDWNGLVLGEGTPWEIVEWGGLEEFTTRTSDVPIPSGWGSIPGSSYVEAKVVVLAVESVNPVDVLLLEAALTAAQPSSPDTLGQVRWKFPLREELTGRARVGRRFRERSRASALGLTRVVFELEFPDPRAYAAAPSSNAVPPFVQGTSGVKLSLGSGADLGLKLPLSTGVDLGLKMIGIAGSGLVTLVNAGMIEAYPVLTFSPGTGISSFSVTNQTTGQVSTFVQQVSPGEQFIVDMNAAITGTGTPVTLNGVSRYGAWQTPRTPLRLVSGPNVFRFDIAAGDAATSGVLVSWSSTYQ